MGGKRQGMASRNRQSGMGILRGVFLDRLRLLHVLTLVVYSILTVLGSGKSRMRR